MKKLFCIFVSFVLFSNLYADIPSSKLANRKTAMRYLQLAKNYVSQGDWDSVKITTENGLKYDDTIADLHYLKALSLFNLDSPRFEVISIVKKSLDNLEWIDYNVTNARIFYADLLSLTGESKQALEVLDAEPFIYSADAEYIRIKSLFQINTSESINAAEEKIESARRVYPKDIRFFYLFFYHEYNICYVEKADKSGFEKKELSPLARKIANSFIYNIPNYDKQYKDLEIIASSFAQGEDRKRLLKAFDARGFKHILYPIFALEENILSQEQALDYFITFIDGNVDANVLTLFYSMITEEDSKKYFDQCLNAFSGTLLYDVNNTLEANLLVKYERGRPSFVTYDYNNDQYIEWDVHCDFGEPRTMNLYSVGALVNFSRYPYVRTIKIDYVYVSNNNMILEMIDDTFLCCPFSIVKSPFIKSHDFYVIDENSIVHESLLSSADVFKIANKLIIPTMERKNGTIEFSNLNGMSFNATYKIGDRIYAEGQYFENGKYFIRNVDNNGDNIFETKEIYSLNPNNFVNLSVEEIHSVNIAMLGFSSEDCGYYLSKIEIDTNLDTFPDFFESYFENGGKLTQWDTDFNSVIDVSYKKHSLEKNKPLIEEHGYLISDSIRGNVFVNVILNDAIPVTIFEDDQSFDVLKGTEKNIYWIGSKDKHGYELNVKGQISLFENAQSFQIEEADCYLRVIRINENIYIKKIDKETTANRVEDESVDNSLDSSNSVDAI